MIRIAICDDNAEAVAQHEAIVKRCLQACGIGCEIAAYTHSENLLCDITDDGFFYDMLLLDIEMPGLTGMELSGKLKPYLPNVKIIFITSHLEYAIDAFELSIFRYVPKDDLENRLEAAVTDAARLIELEADREYIVQSAGHMEKIPYRDIFHIQRDGGKNVLICSSLGTARARKSLQQVYEELDAPEFIFIDRGCIVNIIHIMKLNNGMAYLKNGDALPVSRSHLQEVKRQINQFWGAHI